MNLNDRSLQELPLGETRVDANELDTYVAVCSDSSDGSIHYDAPADDVILVVSDVGASTREIEVRTTAPNGADYGGTGGGTTEQVAQFRVAR